MAARTRCLSRRFEKTLVWALHARQVRKHRILFAAHLLAVASLALEHGADEDQAIGALLHDAIKDEDVTVAEVPRRFAPRVAAIVERLHRRARAGRRPPSRERKEAYLAHLADTSAAVRVGVGVLGMAQSGFAPGLAPRSDAAWSDTVAQRLERLPAREDAATAGQGQLLAGDPERIAAVG